MLQNQVRGYLRKASSIISLQNPFGEIGTPKSRNRHIRKVPVKGKGTAVLAYNSLPQCEPESRKANKEIIPNIHDKGDVYPSTRPNGHH